ncbi:MAG: MTAP family purine nucleoside phosphorylase [Planctomycetota bacterium]
MKQEIKVGVIARVGAHLALQAAGAREKSASPKDTPFGKSNPLHIMDLDGIPFALLSRHGEQAYSTAAPWVNDRANLWALKDAGVEKIVSFSSPGSLVLDVDAGDLLLPDDVLDDRRAGPFSFFEGRGAGVIRMNEPFCTGLSKAYKASLESQGFAPHMGGVYVGTQGPRLETRAEIRRLRMLGGSVVGMTLVPEVFLARELEFCYAGVCLVVNQAEGMKNRPYARGVLFEGLADAEELERVRAMEERAGEILAGLVRAARSYDRSCSCSHVMERYRLRGDLSEDWRRWWD